MPQRSHIPLHAAPSDNPYSADREGTSYAAQAQTIIQAITSNATSTTPATKENHTDDVRVESSERDALHSVDSEHSSGLSVRYLILAYGVFFFALFVCIPKIWLSSSIYYISRDISKLQTQSDLLKEEHRRLQNEREAIRYQYLKAQNNAHTS